MEKNLFRYIWRHSRRDQLLILGVVLASLPFYFASLELPKRIVNEAIQGHAFEGGRQTARAFSLSVGWPEWAGGGGSIALFEGVDLGRYELLFALSGLFLLLVLVNGAFKYWINVAKGALGERMLRRMRFELFSLILRFTPESLRNVKAAEAATIVKDEVEPIGGFIGDAFILPAFLGAQALTALAFILLQNVWLGLLAAGMIAIQFTIIPRLRRELLRLGRERQLASRRLAGRIGEVLEGMELVHVHNAAAWERAEIGNRLYHLFDLRFRIYRRKFMVKFLNNLLAQLTPFFFYAVGGYFALRGDLSIGALVAVIAAYRELPPPLKELIDWDQQRLDVQVKYDQVVQFFSPDRLLPPEAPAQTPAEAPLESPLAVRDLEVLDSHGQPVIARSSMELPLPVSIALVSDGTPAASTLARVLARRGVDHAGTVSIGGHDLGGLPASLLGRRLAYVGADPILFPGTMRENLVYGLRQRPIAQAEEEAREAARRLAEARRTGNPLESIADEWVDLALAGAGSHEELDNLLVAALKRLGMEEDLYRFGLSGTIDVARYPDLADCIVAARTRLREELQAQGKAGLVEPFDPERYNTQATIGENLLFGVPTSKALVGRAMAEHPGVRDALDRDGLTEDLVGMGVTIAETMTEIFRGLPPGHPLFEQFSFLSADELPEYEAILRRRRKTGRGGPTADDRTKLIALPLFYVEPRHRLGLLDDALRGRLVAGRAGLRTVLEEGGDPGVEFYDADHLCAAAPLRDNLLFGRVNQRVANANAAVMEAIGHVVDEMDLRDDIERVGLDHQVGPAGRLLTASQRAAVNLLRSLVKRPEILILDGALAPFGEIRGRALTAMLLDDLQGRTLAMVVPNDREAAGFDALVRFADRQIVLESRLPPGEDPSAEDRPQAGLAEEPDYAEKQVAGAAP